MMSSSILVQLAQPVPSPVSSWPPTHCISICQVAMDTFSSRHSATALWVCSSADRGLRCVLVLITISQEIRHEPSEGHCTKWTLDISPGLSAGQQQDMFLEWKPLSQGPSSFCSMTDCSFSHSSNLIFHSPPSSLPPFSSKQHELTWALSRCFLVSHHTYSCSSPSLHPSSLHTATRANFRSDHVLFA